MGATTVVSGLRTALLPREHQRDRFGLRTRRAHASSAVREIADALTQPVEEQEGTP
ncbi:hypothetical protein VQH23_05685 [Pararoseomonas sp. SCSIO 73927]|uniref:hypothetical protein n=1 Tax=Pararoseomonas sp. SCSIO 73927 TaxID=3114537 RepID=UPI0030CC71AE